MAEKDHILSVIKSEIDKFKSGVAVEKVGTVIEVGDGIARISGPSQTKASEMLDFGNAVFGVAINLEEDTIGAMLLGSAETIKEGDTVKGTGRILSIPVGDK